LNSNPQVPSERGVLSFIDNTVDRTTGTILLKGLFQNEQRRLWPGAFVNVSLTISQIQNAIMVPSAAVQVGQQGAFVFVIGADHKAAMRPVVPGFQLGGETLIERGIEAGETVVTDGQLRLAPGAVVSVKEAL
jgi:multidrug efflux system membrane fusion protein